MGDGVDKSTRCADYVGVWPFGPQRPKAALPNSRREFRLPKMVRNLPSEPLVFSFTSYYHKYIPFYDSLLKNIIYSHLLLFMYNKPIMTHISEKFDCMNKLYSLHSPEHSEINLSEL